MPNKFFVRAFKKALADHQIRIRRGLRLNGQVCLGIHHPDENIIEIDPWAHQSWDEMVITVLHEATHALPSPLPEYLIYEALDRVAFQSPALRAMASRMLGEAILDFLKHPKRHQRTQVRT